MNKELKIKMDVQFICEVDGVYCFWLQVGKSKKMITLTEKDGKLQRDL